MPNCHECNGLGFITSYWLVTHERGKDSAFTRKEKLPYTGPMEHFDYLRDMRKAPASPFRQDVIEAATPCICHAPPQDEEPQRRRR